MSKFFLIFLLTLIITRVFCLKTRIPSPTISGFRTHHYMTGLLLIVLSFYFSNLVIFAIGFGLFVDQMPLFIFWRKWKWEDYISTWSYVGLIFITIIVYLFQDYLISLV